MSYTSTNTYETVYILKPSLSESAAETIHTKIDNVIEKFSGAVKSRDDWGLREMAFPIKNENMGRYCVVVYQGKSGVVEEIERHFRISSEVIRFLTVQTEKDYDYGKAKKAIAGAEEELKKIREAKKKTP